MFNYFTFVGENFNFFPRWVGLLDIIGNEWFGIYHYFLVKHAFYQLASSKWNLILWKEQSYDNSNIMKRLKFILCEGILHFNIDFYIELNQKITSFKT